MSHVPANYQTVSNFQFDLRRHSRRRDQLTMNFECPLSDEQLYWLEKNLPEKSFEPVFDYGAEI
jgi:hypothetical protein